MNVEIATNVIGGLQVKQLALHIFSKPDQWSTINRYPLEVLLLPSSVVGAVAWKDEEPVGCTYAKQTSPELWYLSLIGVLMEHRGQGIGEALFKHTLEEIKRRGGQTIQTDTNDPKVSPSNNGSPVFLEKVLRKYCSNVQIVNRNGYFDGGNQVGIIFLAKI